MGLILNNTSFILRNGSFVSSEPIPPPPPIGQIFRVVNLGPGLDGLPYTKIDGSGGTLDLVTSGQIGYILALSGSLSDSPQAGAFSTLAVTNLLITSSVDITPTFTEELITTTGVGTWTKPVGVTEVIVECWGGGGAGGGATGNPAAGAGGGGGQYSRKYIRYSSPSVGLGYSVGTGGTASTVDGTNGGDTTWQTTVVVSKGGTGGQANAIANNPVFGGVGNQAGSVGDVIYFGGDGGGGFIDTIFSTSTSGNGGSGAGSTSTSFLSNPTQEYGGAPGDGFYQTTLSSDGNPGSSFGGGGGGGVANTNTNRNGGAGASGLIRLIYR